MEIGYSIFKSDNSITKVAVSELLSAIPVDRIPLRLVFFVKAFDNDSYLHIRNEIMQIIVSMYAENRPLVTVVAQAPLDCALSLECHVVKKTVEFFETEGVRYAVASDGDDRYLFTEGILPCSLDIPMRQQAEYVFNVLGNILSKENMPVWSINRQWNYIEHIVGEKTPGLQNYQQLNDARSDFYSVVQWNEGYPAATGIGTQSGGIMVEVDAADLQSGRRVPIDNALQIAAHSYSSDVLVGNKPGKTTPKFERAKAIVNSGDVMLYVSGTAAIRGELSLTGVGIEKQTITTLENIEYLFASSTLCQKDIILDSDLFVTNFRIYLKNAEDYIPAQKVVSDRYPNVPAVYVLSDVCRDELLVEIECVTKNK